MNHTLKKAIFMSDVFDSVSPLLQSYVVKLEDFKFGKKIGEGGFGEVFYGVHEPTNHKCAIKKLFLKELSGSNLKLFCREAEVLSKANNYFCLQFLGWTSHYPFAFITDYIPNGSLFSALRHKESSPDLTPTDKTIIAIGVAKGMEHLHSIGIIHRDLKSLNILLDKNLFPKIIDFGLSRFEDEEAQQMTQDVGTPHWMAPELFECVEYDNKVDVYSFGMLMWEILTESSPFKGMSGVQIAFAVSKKGERPPFPSVIPKSLKDFINQCWHQNPNQRPTMSQIFKQFKDGKVSFPGTDRTEIEKFLKFIRKDEMRRQKNDNCGPPLSNSGIVRESNKSHGKASSSNNEVEFPLYSILSDPYNPDFSRTYQSAISILSGANAKEFFTCLRNVFRFQTDANLHLMILPPILKSIQEDNQILYFMLENGYHLIMPLGIPSVLPVVLMILLISVSRYTQIVTMDFLNYLAPLIPLYSSKVLRIILPFCQSIDQQKNPWEVFDFLYKYHKEFITNADEVFLPLVYHLYKTYPSFQALKLNELVQISNSCLDINKGESPSQCLSMLCSINNKKLALDTKLISSHLTLEKNRHFVISYLLREPSIEISQEFVRCLLFVSKQESIAVTVLYMYCSNPEFCSIMVQNTDQWFDSSLFPISTVFTILLLLLPNPTNRRILAQSKEFPLFMSGIPEKRSVEFMAICSQIIIRMCQEITFLKNLNDSGFFRKYLGVIPHLGDPETIKNSVLIIDVVSRVLFVGDFLIYIPYMFEMLRSNNDYTFPALSAITILSNHEKARQYLKQVDFKRILGHLNSDPRYQPYVALLNSNLTK